MLTKHLPKLDWYVPFKKQTKHNNQEIYAYKYYWVFFKRSNSVFQDIQAQYVHICCTRVIPNIELDQLITTRFQNQQVAVKSRRILLVLMHHYQVIVVHCYSMLIPYNVYTTFEYLILRLWNYIEGACELRRKVQL